MVTDELISDAYYLSGVVSRDFETVAGSQLADGLRMLNQILSEKSMSGRGIPYYGHSTFNAIPDQEDYDIDNLILVDSVTFNIGDVRYYMQRVSRRPYNGAGRVDDISSLPFSYNVERKLNGSTISLYYLPNQAYKIRVTGKFSLSSLDADTDLTLSLDDFYVSYLTYQLAKRLAQFNGLAFSTDKELTLRKLESQINKIEKPDMSMKTRSVLVSRPRQAVNYAQANLGRGWTVP